jgi:hypothetical protein
MPDPLATPAGPPRPHPAVQASPRREVTGEGPDIFVFGLDPFHYEQLHTLREPAGARFHELLSYEESVHTEKFPVPEMLARSEQILHRFAGTVDGIITYWDFPTSTFAPILRERLGQPGPSLEAVLKLEHKYWARCEQREVVPELIPPFTAVNPFAADPADGLTVPYPFWIKPVKAHSSHLGFLVRNEAQLDRALAKIRAGIHRFAQPFNEILAHADLPPHIAPIDGDHCIVEGLISEGHQCTLEGYVHGGRTVVYGVVDSFRQRRHHSCFQRYQYPSRLPRRVQARMIRAARKVMEQTGYDEGPFNMEFYWSRAHDRLRLLEVNARCSKSHSPLFHFVDGASHFQVPVCLSLGRDPAFPHREGEHRLAAKFMPRLFADGTVTRVPGPEEQAALRERFPEALLRVHVHEGQRLSHLRFQDSYSYEIAELFLGAGSQKALLARYREAMDMLGFRIDHRAPVFE